MKDEARAKQARITLEAEEESLRSRLLALLPSASRDGGQLFRNSTNSREEIARYCHPDADALFACANRCVELRESLGLEGEGEAAGYFLAACREAASGDPHRRGPRKLAEWLLGKIAPVT
jgi:hypothetical protein